MVWRASRLSAWALAILAVAAACPAGVVLTDKDGSTTLISDGRFKQSEPGEPHAVVVDSQAGTILYLNAKRRVYAEGTPEELCGTLQAVLDQAMAGMTAEQKAMMEKMMGGGDQKPPEVSVKKLGDGGMVAGLPTTRWQVVSDGSKYEELWLTSDKIITDELGDTGKIMKMLARLTGCMTQGMGGMVKARPEATSAYQALFQEGLPLRVRSFANGGQEDSETLSVDKRQLAPSEFRPPEGYRKTDFTQVFR